MVRFVKQSPVFPLLVLSISFLIPLAHGQTDTSASADSQEVVDTSGFARVLFQSTPASAAVHLNGKPVGTTPVMIERLKAGSYLVMVSADGYRPIEKKMLFCTGARKKIAASLVRFPPGVCIRSEPDGAQAIIDREIIGTTPCFDSSIAIGQHTIAATKDGYAVARRSYYFTGGRRDTVTIAMMTTAAKDSAIAISRKKAKVAGQVLLGLVSVGCFGFGLHSQADVAKAIDDKKAAYAAYSAPGLTQSQYDARWAAYEAADKKAIRSAASRNWLYGIGAVLAGGLAVTIAF
jgi:hypothetical protein